MQSKTLLLLVAAAALAATAGCNRHSEDAAPTPAPSASTGGDQAAPASDATPSSGAATDGATTSGSTMAAIDDTALTAKVKAELLAESSLKAGDITVTTVQGTVTLTGAVDNAAQSDKAAQIVKDTSGVKGVDNQLTVKQ